MSEPRSSSCTSLESIDQEVSKRLHFRPINAAPLTPPKNSPGNSKLCFSCTSLLLIIFSTYLFIYFCLIFRRNCQASSGYCGQELEPTL
jgi:hypothetical protein